MATLESPATKRGYPLARLDASQEEGGRRLNRAVERIDGDMTALEGLIPENLSGVLASIQEALGDKFDVAAAEQLEADILEAIRGGVTQAELDSFKELNDAIKDNDSELAAIHATLATKATAAALSALDTFVREQLANKSALGHLHTIAQVGGLQGKLDDKAETAAVEAALGGKANKTHTHAIADILQLVTALQSKADADAVNQSLADKTDQGHKHQIAAVIGLQAELNGKATANHSHGWASITGKPTTVSGYGITDALTTNTQQNITAHKEFQDNIAARFGNSNDLEIFHASNNSSIRNRTNHLYIQNIAHGKDISIGGEDSNGDFHHLIKAYQGKEVRLAYKGDLKLKTTTGGVSVTGSLTASGNVTAYSDRRLKTDIKPIKGALDKVLALEGVSFRMKGKVRQRYIGFVAQDTKKVVPEVVEIGEVSEGIEGGPLLSIAYANLVALLVEAIKELAEIVGVKDGAAR